MIHKNLYWLKLRSIKNPNHTLSQLHLEVRTMGLGIDKIHTSSIAAQLFSSHFKKVQWFKTLITVVRAGCRWRHLTWIWNGAKWNCTSWWRNFLGSDTENEGISRASAKIKPVVKTKVKNQRCSRPRSRKLKAQIHQRCSTPRPPVTPVPCQCEILKARLHKRHWKHPCMWPTNDARLSSSFFLSWNWHVSK